MLLLVSNNSYAYLNLDCYGSYCLVNARDYGSSTLDTAKSLFLALSKEEIPKPEGEGVELFSGEDRDILITCGVTKDMKDVPYLKCIILISKTPDVMMEKVGQNYDYTLRAPFKASTSKKFYNKLMVKELDGENGMKIKLFKSKGNHLQILCANKNKNTKEDDDFMCVLEARTEGVLPWVVQ